MNRKFGVTAWLKGEPRPPAGGFDLDGEKFLDWGWICVNLPRGRRRALEVGAGTSPLIPAMLELGYQVEAVDLCTDPRTLFTGITFRQGDFNTLPLEPGFDLIVACSTVEHIGLSGRFDSPEEEDGDLRAMRKMAALLKPEGELFLTIPVGVDGVYKPWHRVYGKGRLAKLLDGFQPVKERYLIKKAMGPWRPADQKEALAFPATASRYALAQFVLRKNNGHG